jgi:(S)-2-hydroxyglutarate dehydrogenase
VWYSDRTSFGTRWRIDANHLDMSSRLHVAIVGAGIVGLATGRELLRRHPELRITVLEKENSVGLHQTGHNSGVIHSGVYYTPGSLKARLCVEGNRQIYAYCSAHAIPAEACGKVIVASSENQMAYLNTLYSRGVSNGVEGVRMIDAGELRRIEPHCLGLAALLVPTAGITNYRLIAQAFAEEIRAGGGQVCLNARVTDMSHKDGHVVIALGVGGNVQPDQVIVCSGLHSDAVARMSGGTREPAIVPFRGNYWRLGRTELVRHLIYPVPDPEFPFLGVHFTRQVDGSVWLGPNAVFAFAREGYGRFTTNPRELAAALAYPGFQRLIWNSWRTGLGEFVRDTSQSTLLKELQRYIPEIKRSDLLPGPSGVRAQAMAIDGTFVDDFVFEVPNARVLNVRNAPSPAATSCLAISRHVADRWEEMALS